MRAGRLGAPAAAAERRGRLLPPRPQLQQAEPQQWGLRARRRAWLQWRRGGTARAVVEGGAAAWAGADMQPEEADIE